MPRIVLKTCALVLMFFLCGSFLSACKEAVEEESSKLDPDVDLPAYPVLENAGTLHRFSVAAFSQDSNIYNDRMELFIDNFSPASTTVEPEVDEDQSANDLGYTRLIWTEIANEEKTALLVPMNWLLDSAPLVDGRFTSNDREYRILENGVLSGVYSSDYKPLYEVIDDNIYERHQSVVFVWDFGGVLDVDSEEDVGGDEIADWESRNISGKIYPVLPYATIWAGNVQFRSGATIYGATRSVARDIIVIEGVYAGGSYDLALANFSSGPAAITDVLNSHDLGSPPLDYGYTVDFFSHHTLHIQFDTIAKKAYLFIANSAPLADKVVVDYIEHPDQSWIEINTTALPKSVLDGLNLPAHFNPVIAGPFGTANDYYYGKRYIKTDLLQRVKLDPVFFLNSIAKDDVQTTFKNWRIERHDEDG